MTTRKSSPDSESQNPNRKDDTLEKLSTLVEGLTKDGAKEKKSKSKYLDLDYLEIRHDLPKEKDTVNTASLEKFFDHLESTPSEEGMPTGKDDVFLYVARKIYEIQKGNVKKFDTLLWTIAPLRWVGWLFLLLGALDVAGVLSVVSFMDAASEIKAIQELVDRVPVPLLGLVLVFWGGAYNRTRLDVRALKSLSWLSLAAGVFYILLAPLSLVDGWRIDTQNVLQAKQGIAQIEEQGRKTRSAFASAKSPEQFVELLNQLGAQGLSPTLDPQQMEELRTKGIERADTLVQRRTDQLRHVLGKGRIRYWIGILKWAAGSLLTGLIFIVVWRVTGWARKVRA